MKGYRPPFSVLRRFHIRYDDRLIGHHNDIAARHGRIRPDLAMLPYSLYRENSVSLRQYSSGILGASRVPTSSHDFRSDEVNDFSPNLKDIDQLGSSSCGNGDSDYRQNVILFSPRSNYAAEDWTFRQNLGPYTIQNTRTDLHNQGHSNGGNAMACEQMSGDHWTRNSGTCQQSPNNLYMGSKEAYYPVGYQKGSMGVQLNSNGYQANIGAHLGDPSRYSNNHSGFRQQDSNGSHNPKLFAQTLPNAMPDVQPAEGDECDEDTNVEGTLEELDTLCKEGDLENAVRSMRKLGKKGICIDLPRYLTLVEACGEAKASVEAKAVHQHLIRFISPVSISTFNRILEMYGKCGSMSDAYDMFNKMRERNLTSWDTMITWYAKNGLGEDAIDMFTRFTEAGLKPDGQMFFGLFDACGALGDVTEGMLHFGSMSRIYGINPSMSHYASIVNMFGSAGYLDEALEFINNMPAEPSVEVWESLMNISRVQGNIELGDRCAQIVEQLDPSRLSKESKDGFLPVKDSDIQKKKVKKASPLEHTKHEYRAGDRSFPESDKIYAILRGMKESLKESGYVPETRFVLHDIDQEGKEEAIMAHSERLACISALMTTSVGVPIRIIKNLRVCVDCHNAFKIIAKLVGREIIMRDAKRFHHFKDGKCTCNDYW